MAIKTKKFILSTLQIDRFVAHIRPKIGKGAANVLRAILITFPLNHESRLKGSGDTKRGHELATELTWVSNKYLSVRCGLCLETSRLHKIALQAWGFILIDDRIYEENLVDDGLGGKRRPMGMHIQKLRLTEKFLEYIYSWLENEKEPAKIPKFTFELPSIFRQLKEKAKAKSKQAVANYYKRKESGEPAPKPDRKPKITAEYLKQSRMFHGIKTVIENTVNETIRKLSDSQARGYVNTYHGLKRDFSEEMARKSIVDVIVRQGFAVTYSCGSALFDSLLLKEAPS